MAPAPFDELFDEGVRLFTDDGDTVEDAKLLRSAMAHIARLGGVVTEHAIDPELAAGGFMHEGAVSAQNGVKGIPSAAETAIVERDLALVAATGVRYHLQHVSAAETVALIEDAKDAGLPVTAEVTPHHLAFDDSFLSSGDPNFKMMPPLRSRRDRQALRDAVKSGVIDAVATDHAPHTEQESAVPFAEAPFGVLGLADAASRGQHKCRSRPVNLLSTDVGSPGPNRRDATARPDGLSQGTMPTSSSSIPRPLPCRRRRGHVP